MGQIRGIISALDAEEDQIRGLDAGADDYVAKTASPALLEARIRKALERADRFSKMDAPAASGIATCFVPWRNGITRKSKC